MSIDCATGGMWAWTGPSLAATSGHRQTVDANLLGRLERELPEDFQVPTTSTAKRDFRTQMDGLLSRLGEELARRIEYGPGVAVLGGEGIDRLSDGQLTALLYGLSAVLGRPMPQNSAGDRIVSVRDERPSDPARARGYATSDRMLMHTDAADVAGLLCLNPAAAGGASLLTSAIALHDVLSDEAPESLHEYYRLWHWNMRGLQRSDASQTALAPIFGCYNGVLGCRYVSIMLREGASCVGKQLSSDQIAALDRFDEAARRSDLVLRYLLRRGESVWVNNFRVLHGREGFEDGPDARCSRHYLRTWVWWPEKPAVSPPFHSIDARLFAEQR